MTVESATYISDLDDTYPEGTDDRSEGDDHIRLIKTVLTTTFPSLTSAVTATSAQLNTITAKSNRAGDTYTGTHDYTGAVISVPTQTAGNSSTQAASTAFVAAAVAGVAAGNAPSLVVVTGTTATALVNEHLVLTNAAATTVTLPASPSAGTQVWVTVANGRTDNAVNRNGANIMALAENMTIDSEYATVRLRYINTALGWVLA